MLGLETLSLFYFNYSSYKEHSNSSQFPLDLRNEKKEEIIQEWKKKKKSRKSRKKICFVRFCQRLFIEMYWKKNPWNWKKNSKFFIEILSFFFAIFTFKKMNYRVTKKSVKSKKKIRYLYLKSNPFCCCFFHIFFDNFFTIDFRNFF